ncbi:hypothetical protein L905_11020 [Agrobacterium sp. TS43]|uniref:hypothetical protein n=1 Tax=Agrobacterium TaxID=357 RepID=UPI0004A19563|nr:MULTISPECIES: hypothetical protein [Agrobacterium]KDR91179.1 hypothetical protein K538_23770 [Agrobacterium tumefaciens GW4]KVK44122.1 hypothetical protein L904_09435 [Agrobacterium sp. LY4]KVK44253.1 hypothetical protein L903_08190 [Agrobacterium sp. JL28]KVK58385.1 hypothetical protein L906_09395 [Agrobacterium sp. TS45]KVK62182.1 hypothetical protein L907_08155 [Agrobacterium sp. C13]
MADDTISISFTPDPKHVPDYVHGYQNQAYENYSMICDKSWKRHFASARAHLSSFAGLAAGFIYSLSLPWFPGVWPVVGYWVFAPAPFVALAIWFIIARGSRKEMKSYYEVLAHWNIANDRMYSPHTEVEIGPEGYKQVTRLDTVQLSWACYHLALTPPDSLVLVFHGTVAVIPNSALPIAAKDIIEKINQWCAAQQKELLPLS